MNKKTVCKMCSESCSISAMMCRKCYLKIGWNNYFDALKMKEGGDRK